MEYKETYRSNISKPFDLCSALLELIICHFHTKLISSRLDCIPSSDACYIYISMSTKHQENVVYIHAKWTYLDRPKSAGLMISYVDGLFRIALA